MDRILKALEALDVATLSYDEWLRVGFALKAEGYDCSVWDTWSKKDKRYHSGECERKWKSFEGTGVSGGTIVQMAKERGWFPSPEDTALDWKTEIRDSSAAELDIPHTMTPVEQLRTYIELLFKPDEYVAYVTNDVYTAEDGRLIPSKGYYHQTAKEILRCLKKYPNDLGATVGDWKKEAGAWIRFNPVDGQGVKNENVTRFDYALVECDGMPVTDQEAMYRKLELPIAALVFSGKKSLHAIVRVDADSFEEYRKRVEFLYDFLIKNGVEVDKQNRNPSRLSRMPGVSRGDQEQTLIATNIGRKSWADWMDYVEGISDELPDIETIGRDIIENPPELAEEVIKGVLRRGHKMLICGPSKAGKSFLLMELCVALTEGKNWLCFPCKKSRVLYINLEIDRNSAINRISKIYETLKYKASSTFDLWNLRGKALPLDKLVPKMIRRMKDRNYDVVVVDPIYKVITGDENNASEMALFCNQFDKICAETGCSVIYCHHHSKGTQGQKNVIDRSSGSGVFARDPDAILDLTEIEVPESVYVENAPTDYATAWRVEGSLREFSNFRPFSCWFSFPVHRIDQEGVLNEYSSKGSVTANFSKRSNYSTKSSRLADLDVAFGFLACNGQVPIDEMAGYLDKSERTIRRYLEEFSEQYFIEKNIIKKRPQ